MKRALFILFAAVAIVARGAVNSSTTWVQYTLTTNPQALPVPFVFQATTDVLVLDSKASPPVTLTQNSDYTVSGGNGATGTVTTIVGGAHSVQVGEVITIARKVPLTQTTNYTNSGPLTAAMIGASFDKLTEITQQLNLVGSNSLQFPADETLSGVMGKTQRAGNLLGFSSNGTLQFYPLSALIFPTVAPFQASSISALKAVVVATLASGYQVPVSGYYAPNDGGGGIYVWNSLSVTADNGGTVIQPNSGGTGRWLLQTSGPLSAKIFGAKGDGATDDTAAMTAFFAAIAGKSGFIPNGTYNITSGMIIGTDLTQIVGESGPSLDTSPSGPVLNLTSGAGPVLQLKKGNGSSNLHSPVVRNLRLKAPAAASVVFDVYQVDGAIVENIAIRGNYGTGKVGMQLSGGQDNVFDFVNVIGDSGDGIPGNYLDKGLACSLGYLNSPTTTTTFRKCYFHYCQNGVYGLSPFIDFNDCIFEADGRGVYLDATEINFRNCWWEANITYDGYFTTNARSSFTDCHFDGYARAAFFDFAAPAFVRFVGCHFFSTNIAPVITVDGDISSSYLSYLDCTFPTAIKHGGVTYQQGSSMKRLHQMSLKSYFFKASAVAASTTYDPVPTIGAIDGGQFVMSDNGHIVGVYLSSTATISAGTFNVTLKKNGVAIAPFSYPAIGLLSANYQLNQLPYAVTFSRGDILTAVITTSSGFSPTGGDLVWEVIVAVGDDLKIN